MRTLPRVLASSVLEALRTREHVVVAPAGNEALRDEVEAIIAPALGELTPSLDEDAVKRAEDPLDGESLGDENAEEVMASIVLQITEQLMESDHVDDIYAEDRIIRRDAYRAIRDILVGYISGAIDVDEPEEDGPFRVRLSFLGYVVANVSQQLEEPVLLECLVRAAGSVGAKLIGLDREENVASFDLPGGPEVGRLALEEAITEELVELVEAGVVELPRVEQMLEMERGVSELPGFERALERAAARTNSRTGCAASPLLLDDSTLLAVLTPLTEEAAAEAETHFAFFIEVLEAELATLGEPEGEERPKKKKSRGKAAEGPPSQTRAKRGRSTRKKRRA